MQAARFLLATALCAAPLAAQAELTVCNETDAPVSIAIGYNEGGTWTSEGWWNISPGACSVVVAGDLTKPYYYWRAEAARYDWEESRYMFCTSEEVFTIRGDTDCEARGYAEEAFNEIALEGATSYTLTLTAARAAPKPDPETPMPGPDAPIGGAAADPPGTHGEPYSIRGILSHCEVFDASMACEVHAEGWRYVANSAGPTPLPLLERLHDMPINTPVTISGDMIGHDGHTAEITIREVTPGGRDSFAHIRDDLQGLWQGEGGGQVLIDGGLWQELLLGMPAFSFPMFIDTECATMPSASPTINLRAAETGEWESCFIILELDATRLRIAYAGTGDEQLYRRVD